jgi:hypothetical protein
VVVRNQKDVVQWLAKSQKDDNERKQPQYMYFIVVLQYKEVFYLMEKVFPNFFFSQTMSMVCLFFVNIDLSAMKWTAYISLQIFIHLHSCLKCLSKKIIVNSTLVYLECLTYSCEALELMLSWIDQLAFMKIFSKLFYDQITTPPKTLTLEFAYRLYNNFVAYNLRNGPLDLQCIFLNFLFI